MRNSVWLAVVLAAAACLAIFGTTPPGPLSADAPDAEFSASRAMDDVRRVAATPHPTASAENTDVRAYLIERMTTLGMEVSTQTQSLPEAAAERLQRWHDLAGSDAEPVENPELVNITGILRGTDPTLPAILLMSHHDTVVGSPGAADDTAGVAVSLEIIRALKSAGPLKRDVVVLMTDAEELGLNGARYFFESDSLRERVGVVINLEARGSGGRTGLFETSEMNGEAVQMFADNVSRPSGTSLSVLIYRLLPNNTDLTPALSGDYSSYNFAFIGRPGLYHSPMATPENLDQGSIQDMGAQVLELTAALASAEDLPEKSADLTFFDVFGLFLISYGSAVGWVLFAVAAVLQLVCLRSNTGQRGWLKSLGASLTVIVGGGALLFALNLLSGAGPGELEYYDRLAAIPRLEIQALLICIAVLAASAPLWAGRSGSIVGIIVALALQIYAPVAANVVVWPLLLSGIAGVLAPRLSGLLSTVVKIVPSALVLGFLLHYGHLLMQGVGPDLPSAVALLAALAIPTLGLLVQQVHRKTVFAVAGACLVAATAIALWVRLDPVAETVAVYAQTEGWKDAGASDKE